MVSTLVAVEHRRPPPSVLRRINPVMRGLLRSPLHRAVSGKLMVLSVRGRKTNRTIPVVVGRHQVDGQLLVSASGAWRHNLRGGAPVRVTLDGIENTGHTELEEIQPAVARRAIARVQLDGDLHSPSGHAAGDHRCQPVNLDPAAGCRCPDCP